MPLAVLAVALLAYGLYAGYFRRSVERNVDSIAVLPFTNESGDADVEYVSDGITAGLINNLSAMAGLK